MKDVKAQVQQQEQPAPTPTPQADKQQPFSSTLSGDLKRRLKMATAAEGRKQYLVLEQALEEYLSRHHPELK
ncbi:hypothetical protein [Deinococcus radiophilus]|uniref:hypothetical protein n=1 Tax=Deinococcus radiophilus TaxID=32062 RepID=UPI001E563587|nr:hypothetical protein [Deinococcus radiophilus]UFA52067.1 hypothetical protein LMT64_14035 [Deinococcus radiophilus]